MNDPPDSVPEIYAANYSMPNLPPDNTALIKVLSDAATALQGGQQSVASSLYNSAVSQQSQVIDSHSKVLGKIVASVGKAGAAVSNASQIVSQQIAGNAAAAMQVSAQTMADQPPPAIGCSGNESDPYIDWCSETVNEIDKEMCRGYGDMECPNDWHKEVTTDESGRQVTICYKTISRPSNFNRATDCSTGQYVPPSGGNQTSQSNTTNGQSGTTTQTNGSGTTTDQGGGGGSSGTSGGTTGGGSGTTTTTTSGGGGTTTTTGGGSQGSQGCCPSPPINITVPVPSVTVYNQTPTPPTTTTTTGGGTTTTSGGSGGGGTPPEHYFVSYCNHQTGETTVVRDDQPRPQSPPWELVFVSSDANYALQVAQQRCQYNQPPPPPPGGGQQTGGSQTPITLGAFDLKCDLDYYRSPAALLSTFPDLVASQTEASIFETTISTGRGIFDTLAALTGHNIIAQMLGVGIFGDVALIRDIAPFISSLTHCQGKNVNDLIQFIGLIHWWGKKSGIPVDDFAMPWRYALKSICRQQHMTPAEANAAYLAAKITNQDWDTIHAINGICPDDALAVLQAARSKPVPDQLTTMRRRGIIGPNDYNSGMRQLGYLEQPIVDALFKATELTPNAQELVQMITGLAGDDNVARKWQLDDQLAGLMGDQIGKWVTAIGLTPEQLKYSWRSHWIAPQAGQLIELFHRLRRDSTYGSEDSQLNDIDDALTANAISPYWRERIKAIRFNPLPIRMLRMGFADGVVKDDEINDSFAKLGFSDDDCDKLTEFAKRERTKQAIRDPIIRQWIDGEIDAGEVRTQFDAKGYDDKSIDDILSQSEFQYAQSPWGRAFQAGSLSLNQLKTELGLQGVSDDAIERIATRLGLIMRTCPPIQDYALGTLSRDDAEQQAIDWGMASYRTTTLLDDADRKVKQQTLTKCIAGTRKQYFLGELNQSQAEQSLRNRGLVLERINSLITQWNCERDAMGKQPPTSVLCRWYSSGQITVSTFADRLINVGWSESDAYRIVADCADTAQKKMDKQAEQKRKADQAAQEKAARQAQRAQQAIARENAQIAKANIANAKARDRREKQVLDIAGKIQKHYGCDLATSVVLLRSLHRDNQTTFLLTQDESIQVLTVAYDAMAAGGSCGDYANKVVALAQNFRQDIAATPL